MEMKTMVAMSLEELRLIYGNNYLVGSTSVSNSSYATSGAHQITWKLTIINNDGILVKFSSDGDKFGYLLWRRKLTK
jgi:hypothetical protein